MEKRTAQAAEWESAARRNNERYVLRLYIAGISPRSTRAIANIKTICDQELNDRYDLQVVDVLQHPEIAKEAQIVAAPTLVKTLPPPLRRFIGDLSDHNKVIVGMNITVANPPVRE